MERAGEVLPPAARLPRGPGSWPQPDQNQAVDGAEEDPVDPG